MCFKMVIYCFILEEAPAYIYAQRTWCTELSGRSTLHSDNLIISNMQSEHVTEYDFTKTNRESAAPGN